MSAVYSFHQIQVICSLLDQQIRKFTAMISAPPGSHYASWLAITKQGAMSSLWTQQLSRLPQWTTHLTMRSEVSQYDPNALTMCSLPYTGHTNEKNFIGLSIADGYIACGSETNEVFAYHKSLPMEMMSHKFGCTNPVTGKLKRMVGYLFQVSVGEGSHKH